MDDKKKKDVHSGAINSSTPGLLEYLELKHRMGATRRIWRKKSK